MRIKIISNGTRSGTQIVDADTGQPLDQDLRVLGVKWMIEDGQPVCLLKLRGVDMEVEAPAIHATEKGVAFAPISTELIEAAPDGWSPPVQIRTRANDDGTVEVQVRHLEPTAIDFPVLDVESAYSTAPSTEELPDLRTSEVSADAA